MAAPSWPRVRGAREARLRPLAPVEVERRARLAHVRNPPARAWVERVVLPQLSRRMEYRGSVRLEIANLRVKRSGSFPPTTGELHLRTRAKPGQWLAPVVAFLRAPTQPRMGKIVGDRKELPSRPSLQGIAIGPMLPRAGAVPPVVVTCHGVDSCRRRPRVSSPPPSPQAPSLDPDLPTCATFPLQQRAAKPSRRRSCSGPSTRRRDGPSPHLFGPAAGQGRVPSVTTPARERHFPWYRRSMPRSAPHLARPRRSISHRLPREVSRGVLILDSSRGGRHPPLIHARRLSAPSASVGQPRIIIHYSSGADRCEKRRGTIVEVK